MYSVSDTFKTYIKKESVSFSWHATMVDLDGNDYTLTVKNVVQNSGKITKRTSSDKLAIGKTCASELQFSLFLDVDRYLLYGATITLYFTLYEGVDANDDPITEDVPMGTFIVSECTQSNGQLHITAYDVMTKFDDVTFVPSAHTDIQSPYDWLSDACTACGVTLGNTSAQIKAMPNGKRNVGYADVVADVKTWRDALGYITALLGGFAYIGRDGKLYIGQYGGTSVDTISASFRYSSDFSDYQTTFNGIKNIFKEDATQEYRTNENEEGLVIDLGTNPFLQFTKENNRLKALQEIIDVWNDVYYIPFKVSMPIMPHYDPADVITFTGNQAGEYDYGAITEIVYSIGGKMSIVCSGENPKLESAEDRFSKTVAGLSSDYTNTRNIGNKDFWILSTTNTDAISVGSTEIQIAEIEWQQNTYVQDIEMLLTVDAVLSATANVEIRLNVDDSADYEMSVKESKSLIGERVFHCTNPQKVTGTGTHTAKVYMKVTDTPLLVGDLV